MSGGGGRERKGERGGWANQRVGPPHRAQLMQVTATRSPHASPRGNQPVFREDGGSVRMWSKILSTISSDARRSMSGTVSSARTPPQSFSSCASSALATSAAASASAASGGRRAGSAPRTRRRRCCGPWGDRAAQQPLHASPRATAAVEGAPPRHPRTPAAAAATARARLGLDLGLAHLHPERAVAREVAHAAAHARREARQRDKVRRDDKVDEVDGELRLAGGLARHVRRHGQARRPLEVALREELDAHEVRPALRERPRLGRVRDIGRVQ